MTLPKLSSPTDDSSLQTLLHRYWGYRSFRPLQLAAIEANLQGRDSVVVLPTGGGKSLCFQLPALVRKHGTLGLVVSPLVSLMKDQVDGLVASGIPAAALNSSITTNERRQIYEGLDEQRYRLLYVTPERLVGEGAETFRGRLREWGVSYVAVDEAHCISQWGHEFRPEYRHLTKIREDFPTISLHAFTATATLEVRNDIAQQLALQEPDVLVGSFDRPNLIYRVLVRTGLKEQIRSVVDRHQGEAGIIYCLSRRDVETLAGWLKNMGHRALPYHAGLAAKVRHDSQEAFLAERADIMVATVAFGMGIDRSNIRYVIHAGAPRSLEHYQQESGRAGRDGLEAECVLFYSVSDFTKWRRMLEQNGDFTDTARHLLRKMEAYAGSTSCRHRVLVEYFDQRYDSNTCNACDWCLKELERVDESNTLAQKILSTVVRIGQNRGISHVIDILRGRHTAQISSSRHQELSTFSLLSDVPNAELRGYLDQLIEQEFLLRTGGPYPVLQLTNHGVRALKGQSKVELYRQPRNRSGHRRRQKTSDPAAWAGVNRDLFEELRQCRLEIARARGVAPYVVLHDSTLRDLARRLPTTLGELLKCNGIGARKAEDLGPIILETIRSFCGDENSMDPDEDPRFLREEK